MYLLATAAVPHAGVRMHFASLDHALWFLRRSRADEWLLYDQVPPSAGYGRGYNQGRITDQRGRLVATVVQEGLMRTAGPCPAPS